MEGVFNFLMRVQNIMVIGKEIKQIKKENYYAVMEIYMKGNG